MVPCLPRLRRGVPAVANRDIDPQANEYRQLLSEFGQLHQFWASHDDASDEVA
jgi:hypothetical protein